MVILILIVLGLCLGSFVNALVWRLHKQDELAEAKPKKKPAKKAELSARELSIAKGRSMCTHCHHGLAAKDLIPVVSYAALKGRCRYCGKPIEDTPLAELLTPLLFVVSYLFWPSDFDGAGLFTFVFWLVFVVGFVALSLYDLRWFLLPNRIIFPLIVLAVLQVLAIAAVYDGGWQTLLHAVWGVVIGSGIFYVLFQVSGGKWIGGGDVKLGILLGLLVGGPANALLLIFVASLLGTIIALPLLATGRATRTTHLPFGPFLMLAAIVVQLFGAEIIKWYTGQFIL